MYEHIIYEAQDNIGYITINNPKTLNALNTATLTELNNCLMNIETDDSVRVIIITGGGEKAFVAGADISEMVHEGPLGGRTLSKLGYETFCRLEKMDKISIAAVNGFALGGGCELAMSCDMRIASEKASFAQPECGLGIIPGFGGTQRLPRIIGTGRAKELIFTCSRIDAQEAYRVGLVNKVVPHEELMDECRKLAARVMRNSASAVILAKQAINAGINTDIDSAMVIENASISTTFGTEDKMEGMTAFLEKRKPNYK